MGVKGIGWGFEVNKKDEGMGKFLVCDGFSFL